VSRLRSRPILLAASHAAALALASGCGGSDSKKTTTSGQIAKPSATQVRAANAKVLQTGGVVYGSFHRYLSKPLHAGGFTAGSVERKKTFAAASTATLYIVRELGQMKQAALVDDKLSQVAVKIDNLVPYLGALLARLRAGTAGAAEINSASGALDGIVSAARTAGTEIPLNKTPAVPGVG
jgi:hypothetical protein